MADLSPDSERKILERMLDRAEAEDAGLLVSDLRGYSRDERITWRDLAAFLGCTTEALDRIALCKMPRPGEMFGRDAEVIAGGYVDSGRLLSLLRLLSFRRLVRGVSFTAEPSEARESRTSWDAAAPALMAARDAEADEAADLLHQAAAQGMAEMIRHLIAEERFDPNRLDREGRSALEVALRAGRASAAQALLEAGARCDFHTAEGATALHLAAHRGLDRIVAVLLSHRLDVDARDMGGLTPLHMAVLGRNVSTAALLIEHGADVHAMDAQGRSPLHHAAGAGSTDAIRLLLSSGADPTPRDAEGLTPADLASSANVRMLLRPSGEAGS